MINAPLASSKNISISVFTETLCLLAVFKKEESVVWQCANCGHVYTGKEAPKVCPVCDHPQAHFQILAKNY